MRDEFKPYFDHNFLMIPGGMNCQLFTAEYLALGGEITNEQAKMAYDHCFDESGRPLNSDRTFSISHDNLSALTCIAKKCGFVPPKFSLEHAYIHPRDLFFYAWANGNPLIKVIGWLFLWITSFCLIYEIAIDIHKNIDGDEVLATDGKLLTWLKIHTFNMPITKFMCYSVLRLRKKTWAEYFNLYFKDPNHPNRILIKEFKGM